jgi:hypothetical protein
MKFEIRNRWNNEVMFEIAADSFMKVVEQKIAERANLSGANLSDADLRGANLSGANLRDANLYGTNLYGAYLRDANLRGADLRGTDLRGADLYGANLRGANLRGAYLRGAYLRGANLRGAYLRGANLYGADLSGANLSDANLYGAYLSDANLRGANLYGANLRGADLTNAKGLVKIMGVEPGNCYWKRFYEGLENNGYRFYVGLNTLRDGEIFAADARIICSYPGFHFASRSWCAVNYGDRPLEARIRIPENAQVNEPWATDGKASASAIEILQVFDTETGTDVTDQYGRPE